MSGIIINGNQVAYNYLNNLKNRVKLFLKNGLRSPTLGTILVGSNKISKVYITNKAKQAKNLGFIIEHYQLNDDKHCQNRLLALINDCNDNNKIDGILVQCPLPNSINIKKVFCSLNPKKDVEGMHPENYGKLLYNSSYFIPCTPNGCLKLIKEIDIKLEGAHVVIVSNSFIIGKPLACLLMNKKATITICNEYTKNLKKITNQADILISATGIANLIGEEHVACGAVVIDIGISYINGIMIGDVNIDAVRHKVKAITPVPGGVGPMTIAMLLENTFIAYKRHICHA